MLKEKAKMINRRIDELVEFACSKITTNGIKDADVDDLKAMKMLLNLLDDLKDYSQEQAEMMENIDEKLDKLLLASK